MQFGRRAGLEQQGLQHHGMQHGFAGADRVDIEVAWLVLEAANDLGDEATIMACRRVIEASLNGKAATSRDLDLVGGYFC